MATKKPRYRLAPGPDVDLEKEDIRDKRGRRVTEDYVEAAVADVHAKSGRGRPSLSPTGSRSPQVTFRLPSELREQAEEQARQEGTKVSDVARRALEEYLARHRHAS
jgi:predicted transcriptional regulator